MNAFTRSGQRVLGSWRYVFVNLAVDEAVGFQLPQNLYQHLLRDAGDAAMQFTEPDGTARKAINDDGRPFVGDQFQQTASRKVSAGDKEAGGIADDRGILRPFRVRNAPYGDEQA